jgi:hypothetical protein
MGPGILEKELVDLANKRASFEDDQLVAFGIHFLQEAVGFPLRFFSIAAAEVMDKPFIRND